MGGGEWLDSAQQTVQDVIIKAPDVTVTIKDEPNYWWMLALAIIPVFIGGYMNKRKK